MRFAALYILHILKTRELGHSAQNLYDHVADGVLVVERLLIVENRNTALPQFLRCDVGFHRVAPET